MNLNPINMNTLGRIHHDVVTVAVQNGWRFVGILFILFLLPTAVNAQNILEDLRSEKAGQGTVVINQSKEIEDLVRKAPAETKPVQKTTTDNPAQPKESKPSTPATPPTGTTTTPRSTDRSSTRQTTPPVSDAEYESPAVDTSKKVMRRSYKTTGYRVQVYSGGNRREDKQKCEQIAARLKSVYPSMPIYVHFYSPSWKCRMGNFTSQAEATQVLQEVRRMGYSQACLVKGSISVQY